MKKEIVWECVKVKVADLIENPDNPKIITETGKKYLKQSLGKWGLAETLTVNRDMKIINGHSRKRELEQMGVEEIWVSMPPTLLTEKEYTEFNAIHDVAKAGAPDTLMMESILEDEVLIEYDLKQDGGKKELITEELRPFHKTHILISFAPEKIIEIQEALEFIKNTHGVEMEQGSN